jgi:hypothetical protein
MILIFLGVLYIENGNVGARYDYPLAHSHPSHASHASRPPLSQTHYSPEFSQVPYATHYSAQSFHEYPQNYSHYAGGGVRFHNEHTYPHLVQSQSNSSSAQNIQISQQSGYPHTHPSQPLPPSNQTSLYHSGGSNFNPNLKSQPNNNNNSPTMSESSIDKEAIKNEEREKKKKDDKDENEERVGKVNELKQEEEIKIQPIKEEIDNNIVVPIPNHVSLSSGILFYSCLLYYILFYFILFYFIKLLLILIN